MPHARPCMRSTGATPHSSAARPTIRLPRGPQPLSTIAQMPRSWPRLCGSDAQLNNPLSRREEHHQAEARRAQQTKTNASSLTWIGRPAPDRGRRSECQEILPPFPVPKLGDGQGRGQGAEAGAAEHQAVARIRPSNCLAARAGSSDRKGQPHSRSCRPPPPAPAAPAAGQLGGSHRIGRGRPLCFRGWASTSVTSGRPSAPSPHDGDVTRGRWRGSRRPGPARRGGRRRTAGPARGPH